MTHDTIDDHTLRARQVGQGLALVVAPWAFVIANADHVLNTPAGLDDMTSRGALLISAADPTGDKWFSFVAMIGCLLLVPAVLGAMTLVRRTAARTGQLGGVLMVAGYVCYFAMLFQGFATVALAQHGGASSANVAVLDATQDQGFFIAVALTFVVGNIVGTFLLGIALMRARAVPRWAALCILAWPVLHIVGGSWGEVIGAVAEAIGLGVVGWHLLRHGAPVASAGGDASTGQPAQRPTARR